MLSFTTGSLESMFSPTGINGDMNVTLWPLQVLFHHRWVLEINQTSSIHTDTKVLISPAEWHPSLLWLPGPGPSDLLGSLFCFSWSSHQHAGGLAYTSARPPGRKAAVLHSLGQLWWEGLPVEAWRPWETCQQGVWSDSGHPPGQASTSPQPDESWVLKTWLSWHVLNKSWFIYTLIESLFQILLGFESGLSLVSVLGIMYSNFVQIYS